MGMVFAALTIVLLGVLVAMVAAYASELKRMARFLEGSPSASNERLERGLPLPGCQRLVLALDRRLEAQRGLERDRQADARLLQQELASLSHDIRTPLTGAKGYLQLAITEEVPAERDLCLKAASHRLEAMQTLLDQLFSYTRSWDAKEGLEMREVDVGAVLEEVFAGAYPLFEEREVVVQVQPFDEPLVAMADPEALRRVFDNVIGNAAEHGMRSFRVTRSGRVIAFSNETAPQAAIDASRVFERFYQGDPSRREGHAGLGLATVKNLAEGMGLAVGAKATEGAFTLTLGF